MPRLSAAEAAQIIGEEQRKLANSRRLPITLERIRILMRDEAFPVCNVGPWEHRVDRACFSLVIPGYDPATDDKKLGYAPSELIDSVRREAKIVDENEFSWFEDDGHVFARDCIGLGFGLLAHNCLVQYGVFVPNGKRPTPEEIAAAQEQLRLYRDRLIQDARVAYDKGPIERGAVIGDRHLWAARSAGINEAWVHHQHTQESKQCTSCGKFNPAGIAMCQCGQIIDFELYVKNESQQRAMKAEVERRLGGPPAK
jgi:hypothetical protein